MDPYELASDILFLILVVAVILAEWIRKKQKVNFEKKCFVREVHAVMSEISAWVNVIETSSYFYVAEDMIRSCELNVLDVEDPIYTAYTHRNYRKFAYCCALKYAKRYREDDFERIRIESYCEHLYCSPSELSRLFEDECAPRRAAKRNEEKAAGGSSPSQTTGAAG